MLETEEAVVDEEQITEAEQHDEQVVILGVNSELESMEEERQILVTEDMQLMEGEEPVTIVTDMSIQEGEESVAMVTEMQQAYVEGEEPVTMVTGMSELEDGGEECVEMMTEVVMHEDGGIMGTEEVILGTEEVAEHNQEEVVMMDQDDVTLGKAPSGPRSFTCMANNVYIACSYGSLCIYSCPRGM